MQAVFLSGHGKDDVRMRPVHEKLKQIVKYRGLTAHGFAIRYGFNVSTISDILEGRSNPKIDTLTKIAECLEISMAELLCEPEEIEMVKCKSVLFCV